MSTRVEFPPAPPPGFRSMADFDPSKPALLHDELNEQMVNWTGFAAAKWRSMAAVHSENRVEYDGIIFDGWTERLDGQA